MLESDLFKGQTAFKRALARQKVNNPHELKKVGNKLALQAHTITLNMEENPKLTNRTSRN